MTSLFSVVFLIFSIDAVLHRMSRQMWDVRGNGRISFYCFLMDSHNVIIDFLVFVISEFNWHESWWRWFSRWRELRHEEKERESDLESSLAIIDRRIYWLTDVGFSGIVEVIAGDSWQWRQIALFACCSLLHTWHRWTVINVGSGNEDSSPSSLQIMGKKMKNKTVKRTHLSSRKIYDVDSKERERGRKNERVRVCAFARCFFLSLMSLMRARRFLIIKATKGEKERK